MKRSAILVLLAVTALAVVAGEFENAVDRIVQANPVFAARQARIVADNKMSLTEINLNDPEVSFEALFGRGDNKYNVEITQSFDWPSLYRARRERTESERLLELARLAAEQADMRLEVETSLFRIITAKRKINDYTSTLQIMTSLLDINQRHFNNGDVSIVDVNKLRIEVADYEQMLEDELQILNETTGQLKTMTVGIDIDSLVATIDQLPLRTLLDRDTYLKSMTENSPQLAVLEAQMQLDRQNRQIATLMGRPGFTVGYRYANEDAISYNGFVVGMSLPFWSNKGKREAADAAIVATDLEHSAAVSRLSADIDNAYATAKSLKQRIDNYGKALTTTDNRGILQRAFDAGQITLTEFILDTRYFVEANIRLYDLENDYAIAVASLQRYL